MIRGHYKKYPKDFREILRTKTKWKKIAQTLWKLALGNYTFQNYNGQTIVAQPNLEAIKILIFISWGKYPDYSETDEQAQELMKKFAEFSKTIIRPQRTDNKELSSLSVGETTILNNNNEETTN